MSIHINITHRLTGLLREVSMRGYDGRWQLRMGLEDTLKYAEFMLRPLQQGAATDASIRAAYDCVAKAWDDAMEQVFADDDERHDAQRTMCGWLKASHEVNIGDIPQYLRAIAANIRQRRVA